MVRTHGLQFSVGAFALRDVALHVKPGEYFVLLGRPGSGKTLLLECLAGLKRIDAGRIEIGGEDVTRAEPRARGVGYVPQDYALFPTMSAGANIAFGLRRPGMSRADREARVAEVAGLLNIAPLLPRPIAGLSGGEKQRVALGRALAVRPRVLLLDEPLSTLDEDTREGIVMELKSIQRRTGTTTIHVCHNLEEMMALADRTAILSEGRIVQEGAPDELCRRPASPDVARFLRLGSILRGRASRDGAATRIESQGVTFEAGGAAEGDVSFLVRAEAIRVVPGRAPSVPANSHEGVVTRAVRAGASLVLDVAVSPIVLRSVSACPRSEPAAVKEGDAVTVCVPPEAVHVFADSKDGRPGSLWPVTPES